MSTVTAVSIPAVPTGAEAPKPAADPNRPAWLPAKFETPEAFAKSYAELESKLGAGSQTTPPATQTTTQQPAPTQTTTQTPPNPADPNAAQQTPAKPDLSAFEKEFQDTGKFSDESYAKLANLGISRAMVDQYTAGVVAAQNAQRAEIYSVAGGEQNFAQIVQWAQTGLSDAEKTSYNDAVKSGNVAAVKLAVSGMAAKYQQSYGRDPKLVAGRASAPGPEAFTSWAQVTKAMSDPRYDSDPAYRAEVENRIAASKTL